MIAGRLFSSPLTSALTVILTGYSVYLVWIFNRYYFRPWRCNRESRTLSKASLMNGYWQQYCYHMHCLLNCIARKAGDRGYPNPKDCEYLVTWLMQRREFLDHLAVQAMMFDAFTALELYVRITKDREFYPVLQILVHEFDRSDGHKPLPQDMCMLPHSAGGEVRVKFRLE